MEVISHELNIERDSCPVHDGQYRMSRHALHRMYERGLSLEDIEGVLTHGQAVYDRGAITFRIGRRVAALIRAEGVAADHLEGLHVVASTDGTIVTVYRNHDFRRPRKTRKPTWPRRQNDSHSQATSNPSYAK